MEGETAPDDKGILLSETLNELKKQLESLNEKKKEVQQKLDGIKNRLEATQEAEHKAEERMKDIIEVEAQLEQFMNEEDKLTREKLAAESELLEYKEKLGKIDEISKKIKESE